MQISEDYSDKKTERRNEFKMLSFLNSVLSFKRKDVSLDVNKEALPKTSTIRQKCFGIFQFPVMLFVVCENFYVHFNLLVLSVHSSRFYHSCYTPLPSLPPLITVIIFTDDFDL
jgi:hypothetical protein